MASARESNTREETSGLVTQLSGGLDQVLKTAEAAAAARRASTTAVGATPAAPAGALAGERRCDTCESLLTATRQCIGNPGSDTSVRTSVACAC
jgi:hypothetical protein